MTIETLEAQEVELVAQVNRAASVIFANVAQNAPRLAVALERWLRARSPGHATAHYFIHPDAHPVLYLSRWYAASHSLECEPQLQRASTQSCVAACLWIRILDDAMDEGARSARVLLPAVAPLHDEILRPYRSYFAQRANVMLQLESIWHAAAENTHADAALDAVDEPTFRTLVASKFSAAMMPIIATAAVLHRTEDIESWQRFLQAFATWHQMLNDTADWASDLRHGVSTFFLSHARVSAGSDRAQLTRFVLEHGLHWAAEKIAVMWSELCASARPLQSEYVDAFLIRRQARYRAQLQSLLAATRVLNQLKLESAHLDARIEEDDYARR